MIEESKIESAVIEALKECQRLCGVDDVEIDLETTPHNDLVGFDSLTGVETVMLIEQKLGLPIPTKKGCVNLFADGSDPLSVTRVVNRIGILLKNEKRKKTKTNSVSTDPRKRAVGVETKTGSPAS